MPVRIAAAMLPLLAAVAIAPRAHADTILDLSETAHVSAKPDEITASLRAEATSATPQEAQASVNDAMARALKTAHAAQGVTISTGQYSVWNIETPPVHPGAAPAGAPQWHASQTLDLTGKDGAAMLALVGALQGQDLAVQSLSWHLSPDLVRATQETALRQAVSGLRARAEEMAGLLGLRFASFRTVRLTPEPPRPMPMMMMRAAAAPMSAPSAEQGPIEVTATITAEAVLVGQ